MLAMVALQAPQESTGTKSSYRDLKQETAWPGQEIMTSFGCRKAPRCCAKEDEFAPGAACSAAGSGAERAPCDAEVGVGSGGIASRPEHSGLDAAANQSPSAWRKPGRDRQGPEWARDCRWPPSGSPINTIPSECAVNNAVHRHYRDLHTSRKADSRAWREV